MTVKKPMNYKVSELEGGLLDAAVAKTEGLVFFIVRGDRESPYPYGATRASGRPHRRVSAYSSNWLFGGPIIERERIEVSPLSLPPKAKLAGKWFACIDGGKHGQHGETALIAAMRSYVARKFGDELILEAEPLITRRAVPGNEKRT